MLVTEKMVDAFHVFFMFMEPEVKKWNGKRYKIGKLR